MKYLVVLSLLLSLATPIPALSQAEAPATTQPTDAPAVVLAEPSDDAKPIVAAVVKAYEDLESLKVTGQLRGEFDVQGQQNVEETGFTGIYQSPLKFRHQLADVLAVGSTGTTLYLHGIAEGLYDTVDAPEAETPMSDLPHFVGQFLSQQNLSLMLAISSDPRRELLSGAGSVDRDADVEIDGKSYQTLRFLGPEDVTIRLRIDPQTNLIRQAVYDMRPLVSNSGAIDVAKAEVTVDYTEITAGAELADDAFAWTAPADARSLADVRREEEAKHPGKALEGEPAPALTLRTLDGEEITLADRKGDVVLLDFWATWCAPCIASMPHLQAMSQKYADQGFHLYAINVAETREQVTQFLADHGFELKVLMDADASAFQMYRGQGLPYQVLVGRDGVIRRVSWGIRMDGGHERALEQAIEAALAESP